MEKQYFITITGLHHYYDKRPFEIGRIFKLKKEPDNEYDEEAIKAELPYIGTVGYVANSANTVYTGTVSAGRLYDHIGDYTYAQVLFVTHSSAIALVLPPEEVEEGCDVTKAEEPAPQTAGKMAAGNSSGIRYPIGFRG